MSVKIKNRHSLKKKDIREIQDELVKEFDQKFIDHKLKVEIGFLEDIKIIFIDETPCFIYHNSKIIFTIPGINKFALKKNYVVVDMGAVKFVTNGADIMAPGIVDADKNIKEKDQVWICDETHHKPLAVGIALMSGEEMVQVQNGKAIKTIHFIGDTIWNYTSSQ
jgi:PUA domain protein